MISPSTPDADTPVAARALEVDPPHLWRVLLFRGILALLFGIVTLIWPGGTVLALALLFGAYALIDGVGLLVEAFRRRGRPTRWPHRLAYLAGGLFGVAAAVVTVLAPGITVLVLTTLAGVWAIVTGVLEVVAAVRLRKHIRGELLLALAGVASVAFGLLILLWPGAGGLALAVLLGSYALVFGVLLVIVALQLRTQERTRTDDPDARG